jgi:hypothetical protein
MELLKNVLEKSKLTNPALFVNGIYENGGELALEVQRLDLTFLQSSKAGSHEESLRGQFAQDFKILIAWHGPSDFKCGEYAPGGSQHFIRKSVMLPHPIQWVTPDIVERLTQALFR